MKRNVLVFGSISAVLLGIWVFGSMAWYYQVKDCQGSMLAGYTAMLLALSLVFVGVKNYRDKQNGGVISFGKAFKIGLLIALIASTGYVVAWLIDYYAFIPDFMDRFSAHMLKQAHADGLTGAALSKKVEEINTMKKLYQSPVMVILFTYMEVLPVGLIVSLITALILKRKAKDGAFVEA